MILFPGLTLTIALFLILITVIDRLNRSELFEKVIKLFVKNNINKNINEEAEESEKSSEQQVTDGLLQIKREHAAQEREAGASLEQRVYSALYIAAFLGIACWRIIVLFKTAPWAYIPYRAGILNAVLLLVIPCVCVSWLKMKKAGSYPADMISRDILTLFSYTALIYAAVIAASSVLKINFLIILPFVYYAVTLYLIAALAVNIALSMLKGDILSFDYALFPRAGTRAKEKTEKWNVSLKSLYTIKYTLTILPALALSLIILLMLSTTIFVVQPHQQAAVYHFGKLDRSSIKSEGIHFKFPWPIDTITIYDVHRAASMQIGYESSGTADFLWTKQHDGGEYMLLLGNGNEMAAVNLKVMYVISDLYAYIKTCTNPEAVLNGAAYNALMSRTVNTTLDSFLSVDRHSLSVSVLNELSRFCAAENLGFSVVQVIVESIHPPVDIADVYQNVVSASVNKTTLITRAQGYAAAKVIEAHKQSRIAVEQARAMQHSKISDAQKEAAVFYAAGEAYRVSPGSFELTKYLDVYEKIIGGNKVYVFSPGVQNSISKFIIGKVNTVNVLDANKGDGNE